MHPLRRNRPATVLLAPAIVLLATLAACGGTPTPPSPSGVVTVSGSIDLPSGHGISLATLSVTTPMGSYAVSSTGAFTADVFGGAVTEIGVETASGDLLLLGLTQGTAVQASLTSTAEALLYYLVGGMWLPAGQQDKVRSLLSEVPEVGALRAELQRQLLSGGNGLASPDAATLSALEAAHESLVGHARPTAAATPSIPSPGASATVMSEAGIGPLSETPGSNIIIHPSATIRAGVQVLHNPDGAGVVAQNHFRRPVALLAYETGWEDADGLLTEHDMPIPIDRVEVPATGQLEFFNALLDVVTFDSPWSPVLSPPIQLAGHEGASRTHYQLVVVGPSGTDTTWPIMDDERFSIFHGHWAEIEQEKSLELFLDELLLPLIEVYGLGSMAKFDAAKLSQMRDRVRLIHNEHLLGLGVYLANRQGGYVSALRYVITELVENRHFQMDMVYLVRDALQESDRNKATIEALEKRLASRASATAIAAAVQTLLVGGDVAKIMYDLVSAPAVVDWTAISAPTLFALAPDHALVTRTNSSARFTVFQKGQVTGNFLYRWSTSGVHGDLSDLLHDGKSLVTASNEIWYFHGSPLNIEDGDRDTVTVEVFEVAEGATTIPAGAAPVARMAAIVEGKDWNIDPRIQVEYGTTSSQATWDGSSWPCVQMYLRFDAVPGAKSYTVHARNVGGQNDARNSNEDFRIRGSDHSVFIDPNAVPRPGVEVTGYVRDWNRVCVYMRDGHYALPPISFSARYDRVNNQYIVNLFHAQSHPSVPVGLAGRVSLWHDWVKDAIFEVVVGH